ncbi:unnamed protein product [Sphagnum balticum]
MSSVYLMSWKAPKKIPNSLNLLPNDYRIIAISIQDVGDQDKWSRLVMEAVDKERYILVGEKISSNNLLKVFALKELATRISFVETAKVKFKSYYNTVLSNKCANLVRFNLDNTKLVFCGCQLEYGRELQANRIRNLK